MSGNNPLENTILGTENQDKSTENQDIKKVLKSIKIKDSISELALYEQLGLQENKVPENTKEEIKGKIKALRAGDKLKLMSNFDIVIERNGVERTFASLGNYETKIISELLNSRELIKEETKVLVESLSVENKARYYILFGGDVELSKLIKSANQKDIYMIFGVIRKLGLEKNENYNLIRKSFTKENAGGFEINLYGNDVLEKYLTIGDIFGDQKNIFIGDKLYTQKSDGTFRSKRGAKLKMKEGLFVSFNKSNYTTKPDMEEKIPKEKKQKNVPKGNEAKETGKETLNLDEKMSTVLNSVAPSLGLDPEHVKSLIIRESGGKIDAKSNTGSRGIMQLTGSVFADMKLGGGGRGENYMEYFAKIPTEVINMIGDKNSKSRQAIQRIIELSKSDYLPDKKEYNSLMNQAKKGIYDPVLNMVMGCIYLTYQKEHGTKRTIKKLNTKILNSLIAGKGITSGAKETQEYLVKLKKQLKSDPELQAEYNACVNYNADKTPERDGVGHMNYFGAAVMITKLAREDRRIALMKKEKTLS